MAFREWQNSYRKILKYPGSGLHGLSPAQRRAGTTQGRKLWSDYPEPAYELPPAQMW